MARIVVAYERVSTDAQDLTRQAVQRDRAAGEHPDCELRVIQDDGISAYRVSIFDRPGGRELVRLIETGDVEAVWADAQDRLSRGKQSEWWQFIDLCEQTGTRIFIDGREIKPWEDEGDEIKSALDALMARRESRNTSHRTLGGKAKSAAAGRVNGGPRRFGFEPGDGTGQLTPRPEEMAVVELMFRMAHAGKSQTGIARELNAAGYRTARGHAWSQPQVGQVLRDRIWLGELVNMAGTFQIMEPLIDPEQWHGVQRAFGKRGERRGRPSEKFLLVGGLLRCGSCGASMRTRNEHHDDPSRKSYEHYSCSGRREGSTQCKQGAVRRELIDRAVLAYFENVGLDMDATLAEVTGERDRRLAVIDVKLTQARKVMADAERQIERLDAMMRDEGLTLEEWRRLAAVPQREAEAAELALADLMAERDEVASAVDAIDVADDLLERITALRSTVAGEIVNAEGIAATRVALRRVFDGFVLHRADSPDAPRRVNSDLAIVEGYVLEPLVADDARLCVMPAGTPVVERVPLELETTVGSIKGSRR
jgi:site-specific DNA recombinase